MLKKFLTLIAVSLSTMNAMPHYINLSINSMLTFASVYETNHKVALSKMLSFYTKAEKILDLHEINIPQEIMTKLKEKLELAKNLMSEETYSPQIIKSFNDAIGEIVFYNYEETFKTSKKHSIKSIVSEKQIEINPIVCAYYDGINKSALGLIKNINFIISKIKQRKLYKTEKLPKTKSNYDNLKKYFSDRKLLASVIKNHKKINADIEKKLSYLFEIKDELLVYAKSNGIATASKTLTKNIDDETRSMAGAGAAAAFASGGSEPPSFSNKCEKNKKLKQVDKDDEALDTAIKLVLIKDQATLGKEILEFQKKVDKQLNAIESTTTKIKLISSCVQSVWLEELEDIFHFQYSHKYRLLKEPILKFEIASLKNIILGLQPVFFKNDFSKDDVSGEDLLSICDDAKKQKLEITNFYDKLIYLLNDVDGITQDVLKGVELGRQTELILLQQSNKFFIHPLPTFSK